MSRSESLGQQKEVDLQAGVIRYRERGAGPPIVFVHGLLVNGDLWRQVVPQLATRFRCITPDWPLGSHRLAMHPAADLTPPGLARLVADFLTALNIDGATVVGNDTGGAVSQLLVTAHPERVARLVLTDCDAYENFLPPMFRYLQWAAHVPGAVMCLTQSMRLRALRRLPITYGWLHKRAIDAAISDSYVEPVLSNAAVRRDVAKVLAGISSRYTVEAAARFARFQRPVLVVWSDEDRFFPMAHARRLSAEFPNARLERITDSYTFVSEDQPQRLAELITSFMAEDRREERMAELAG